MSRLSVVMVSYNQADKLERAVLSVLTQGRVPDEILIADDCSTDDTVSVARSLEARHDRIRVIARDRNLGVAANRDLAIREATGDVFTTLDADDHYSVGKLEREWTLIGIQPDAVIVSDTIVVGEEGTCIANAIVSALADATVQQRVARLVPQAAPTAKDPMMTKSAYLEAGRLRHGMNLYEDLDLQVRLADKEFAFVATRQGGTVYFASGGLTRTSLVQHLQADLAVIVNNREILERRYGDNAMILCARQRAKARLGLVDGKT